jgi:hypothetical protein
MPQNFRGICVNIPDGANRASFGFGELDCVVVILEFGDALPLSSALFVKPFDIAIDFHGGLLPIFRACEDPERSFDRNAVIPQKRGGAARAMFAQQDARGLGKRHKAIV